MGAPVADTDSWLLVASPFQLKTCTKRMQSGVEFGKREISNQGSLGLESPRQEPSDEIIRHRSARYPFLSGEG
jgi:hypothetical protein